MRQRYVISFIAVVVLAAAGLWLFGRPTSAPNAAVAPNGAGGPAIPVTVAAAKRQDLPIYLEGLGTVQAFQTVTIRPQVDGQLRQIAFKEGQEVHAGDVLAQIDPRSFQAALDQVTAKKAQDEALLANARNDLQRYSGLVEKNYIARQQLDTTRSQVNQLEAAVQGDAAQIANAQVTLGYATIRSPIDGRAGIRNVDAGNIVHANDATGIVVITQVHPISLLFTLPEEQLQKVFLAMSAGPLQVEAMSRDGKQRLDQGILELVDNQIDQATGTARLKATLPNKKGLLWPGQYLNARLRVEVLPQALTVPTEAIQRGPDGSFVYVVRDKTTAETRPVGVAAFSEGRAVIERGLEPGEMVVVAGQYRLQSGAKVEVKLADAAEPPSRIKQ